MRVFTYLINDRTVWATASIWVQCSSDDWAQHPLKMPYLKTQFTHAPRPSIISPHHSCGSSHFGVLRVKTTVSLYLLSD